MRTGIIAAALVAAVPTAASAQLAPDRLYYGVNRAIPMTVTVPSGQAGEVRIALFEPGSTEAKEQASAAAGRVDLAGLFPVLWTAAPKFRYAQLMVGETKVGSPVALQPLLSQEYAVPAGPNIQWSPTGNTYSGLRAYPVRHVVLETSLGEIEIAMRPDEAPNTVWNFLQLVEGGFYTDIVFHRVVPANQQGHPFVIQAGDPTGQGTGGPGYMLDLERSRLKHDFGVLSMARSNDPNSNGSQFFLCLSREGTGFLDGRYTAFGQTVRGAEAILSISATPLADQASGRPIEPPVIKSARTIPAPPIGEAPAPVTRPEKIETPR